MFTLRFLAVRDQGAGRGGRRQNRALRTGVESLEGRNLLSTAGIDAPGAGNHAPSLADPGTQSVQEGDTLSLRLTATDPDAGQTLTYSLDPGAPAGASIDPRSGLLTWTPPNVQKVYSFSVRVSDDGTNNLSDVKTLAVMVFDVAPAVQVGGNATINAGTAFTRAGSFTDPNPDSWTATVDYGDGSGVRPLTLGSDKTFQFVHTYTTPGKYTVLITINDSQGGQGRGAFSVQVQASQASNPSPVISQGPTSTGPTTVGSSLDHDPDPTPGPVAASNKASRKPTPKGPRFHAPRVHARPRLRPHVLRVARHNV